MHPLPQDVSTVAGCKALAAQLAEHTDRLDILVNNAGAAWGEPFEDFPEKGWDKVMDLNVKSPFFLTQALHPALKAARQPRSPGQGDQHHLDRRPAAQSVGNLQLSRVEIGADLPDQAHGARG